MAILTAGFSKITDRDAHTHTLNLENNIIHSTLTDYENNSTISGYSLKISLNGTEHYEINGRNYRLGKNQYLTVNKGSKISCKVKSGKSVEGLCLYFSAELLQDIWHNKSHTDHELINNPFPDPSIEIPQIINAKYDHFADPLIPDPGKFKSSLSQADDRNGVYYQICETLLNRANRNRNKLKQIGISKKTTRDELYQRLLYGRNFMDDSYMDPVGLKQTAHAALLSEYHFHRLFKNFFSITPHQYLVNRRVSKAMDLLKNGEIPVKSICYQVGFSDPSAFIRLFKSHTGTTPAQFSKGF